MEKTAMGVILGAIATVVVIFLIMSATELPEIENTIPLYYTTGDLVQSKDTLSFVVITGYDTQVDEYRFVQAEVDLHAGKMTPYGDESRIGRYVFETTYPTKVTLHK
jgi:hypothetical protein